MVARYIIVSFMKDIIINIRKQTLILYYEFMCSGLFYFLIIMDIKF